MRPDGNWSVRIIGTVAVLGAVTCTPQQQARSRVAATASLSSSGWIDVTATLDPATTPVYEGDAPMKFEFLKDMRKGGGFTLSVYSMGAHSGTHVDAPMHFIRDGAPIDRVSLEPLMGPARVIDIPDSVQAIDAAELNRHEWRGAERVIFRTRSSLRSWMASRTFHRDFAYIAPDAAQLLANAEVQLVGIDYISAEQLAHSAKDASDSTRQGNTDRRRAVARERGWRGLRPDCVADEGSRARRAPARAVLRKRSR
ncbi:MAG: cyclase family protein [Gemmatimonadota bacterium]|nr:cyclase family protein [Gemmatimonadota bacterium]